MRIGFGATLLNRGHAHGRLDGIGVYCQSLLRAQGAMGVRPRCFYWGGDPDTGLCLETSRISALPFPAATLYSALTRRPAWGHEAVEREIDVFHAPDHRIPRLGSVPVVATVMDAIPLAHPEWASASMRWLKNRLFAESVKWADHVITISSFVLPDLVEYLHIPAERISVVPLGVDEAYFDRVEQEVRAASLDKYGLRTGFFLFIGTLQPRKNVERIIFAHRALPHAVRSAHPLVIVGQNGWGTESLMPMLAGLKDEGVGVWLDYVPRDDMFALMQSASALVFPSLYEGFGLPVLEAFASGLPVIASNTTSLPEVAGDAALLVDPENVEEIAHAMARIIVDPALAGLLREKGLARARELSWANCATRTLQVYRSMIMSR